MKPELKSAYDSKFLSVKDAAKKIEPNDKIFIGPGNSCPIATIDAIADRVDELKNVDVISALQFNPLKIFDLPYSKGKLTYHSTFMGPYERECFQKGGNIASVTSVGLSKIHLAIENFGTNVLLIEVSEMDEDGYFSYGPMGVAVSDYTSHYVEKIIVQVNKEQIRVKGGEKSRIHISRVTWICEDNHKLVNVAGSKPTQNSEIGNKISEHILPLISDGSCIQIGIGSLSNTIAYSLECKKDLSVRTEMLTDVIVHLAKKGAITGSITACFGLGSDELYEFARQGKCEFVPIVESNHPFMFRDIEKFVSINTCLMTDLTGQVCSEAIGHYQYSGIGGQLDFALAAQESKGGKSFLCLPSTAKGKSTITLDLPAGTAVTTPRSEVMYIVTEYGVADVYLKSIEERALALINIAHPDFREGLLAQAKEVGLIR